MHCDLWWNSMWMLTTTSRMPILQSRKQTHIPSNLRSDPMLWVNSHNRTRDRKNMVGSEECGNPYYEAVCNKLNGWAQCHINFHPRTKHRYNEPAFRYIYEWDICSPRTIRDPSWMLDGLQHGLIFPLASIRCDVTVRTLFTGAIAQTNRCTCSGIHNGHYLSILLQQTSRNQKITWLLRQTREFILASSSRKFANIRSSGSSWERRVWSSNQSH